MGFFKQGISDRIPSNGEVWSDTEDIYRVGQSPNGLTINKYTTVISAISNICKLGGILKYLSLAPYKRWEEMEHY